MSLDTRTKNILVALEHTLNDSKKLLDPKTHEEMVNTLLNSAISVKESYDKFKAGDISPKTYSKVLIKLAEITLMAVRRLPS
jgi:hypothetical protein